jgi:ATP-dependent DNA helicase RecQ
VQLQRGEDGTGKPLSCTHSTLRLIAERKPRSLPELERIQGMGPQKAERFGPTFLDIILRF